MRSWSVPASVLCRQHLLGEHVEVHTMWSALRRGGGGYWKHPETQRWLGHLAALHARHEALASEIAVRGWNHRSPLAVEGIADWGSAVAPPRIQGDVPRCDRCDALGRGGDPSSADAGARVGRGGGGRMDATPAGVDEYIAAFPAEAQRVLRRLRAAIRRAAPGAAEAIAYRMPAYRLNGPLVYFAGHARHYALYPGNGTLLDALAEELRAYKVSKGAIQFAYDVPLPVDLVTRIVRIRVEENAAKAAARRRGSPRV